MRVRNRNIFTWCNFREFYVWNYQAAFQDKHFCESGGTYEESRLFSEKMRQGAQVSPPPSWKRTKNGIRINSRTNFLHPDLTQVLYF